MMNIFRKALTLLTKTPLAAMVAMTMIVSALSYTACDIKNARDADKNDELALAVILLAAASSQFPVTAGNVFSIQFRNSTSTTIAVWLIGDKPPCSRAEASNCNNTGWSAANWETKWNELREAGVFSRSGTHFYNISKAGVSTEINVSIRTVLQPGETLRIVPPIVDGKFQWFWCDAAKGCPFSTGSTAWVTRDKTTEGVTISKPDQDKKMTYEFFTAPIKEVGHDEYDGNVHFNLSAVNGLNTNATMNLEGQGCTSASCGCINSKSVATTLPKVCKPNIDPYNGLNDGCPYSMVMAEDSSTVCPNPKSYPTTISISVIKPSWVVGTDEYTQASANSYTTIWDGTLTPNHPTGLQMASAASPLAADKKAYHIWWATNPVGQGWLKYLQSNAAGKCDAYGWAYDERKWKDGDSFDGEGNPPDNALDPLANCPFSTNSYLNIDILKIL